MSLHVSNCLLLISDTKAHNKAKEININGKFEHFYVISQLENYHSLKFIPYVFSLKCNWCQMWYMAFGI